MTLKDAYELHIESDRFSSIVKDNLKEDLEFLTDGGVGVAIRDFEERYMGKSIDNNIVFNYYETQPIYKKVFAFDVYLEITYYVFGLKKNSSDIDQTSVKFWLMEDNYVCIYADKLHKVIELSDFIKMLKNPVTFTEI